MDPVYIQFSTLVIALATGVTLLVTAQHLRIPAIVPLLLGGILLGPEVSGLIDPADLGNGLDLLVAGCVAVILFEGGLSLQRIGFEQAPKVNLATADHWGIDHLAWNNSSHSLLVQLLPLFLLTGKFSNHCDRANCHTPSSEKNWSQRTPTSHSSLGRGFN